MKFHPARAARSRSLHIGASAPPPTNSRVYLDARSICLAGGGGEEISDRDGYGLRRPCGFKTLSEREREDGIIF